MEWQGELDCQGEIWGKRLINMDFQSLQVYNLSVYFTTSLQKDARLLTPATLFNAHYGQ